MNEITTVAIDLAKLVFQLLGTDSQGRVLWERRVRRSQLLHVLAQLAPCTVVMEACGGAHYWAREVTTAWTPTAIDLGAVREGFLPRAEERPPGCPGDCLCSPPAGDPTGRGEE